MKLTTEFKYNGHKTTYTDHLQSPLSHLDILKDNNIYAYDYSYSYKYDIKYSPTYPSVETADKHHY